MKTVMQVLQGKSNQATYTITPQATVLEAISLMADKGIGALIVAEGDRMVGIVSERDYARKVVLMERSSYNTLVRDIMTSAVLAVTAEETTERCMGIMTEKRLRHLPVLSGENIIGIVSIGDLVKEVISEQQQIIEHLEQYIRGE
ncbi:CBS domain-containing protein [Paraperlucidibaca wandonensis]|uniref:CBS domain-containing protein n=1 Tax=Paraperlucidibaca wandonensis TaxID=1268273 RepID=A0ABW3HIT4_9GAMM|nr:CBS domain-containing protein [Paraperlucidibaca sp.]MBQ0722783.1 CBS domain-containing protein [Paraperlucidibaca sp.]MBQ0841923.1 CBS domain-containing protein [Paraperlucidibaca sp.]